MLNAQLSAVALLVKKFGKRVKGGFEVEVTFEEMTALGGDGTFQEIPNHNMRTMTWRFNPNDTIDVEGRTVPDEVPLAPVIASGTPYVRQIDCNHKSTVPYSFLKCNMPKGHSGQHSKHDSYDLLESWDD